MDEKQIQEFVEASVANHLKQVELSKKLERLETLEKENQKLVTKLSEVEDAKIPTEKAEELTEVIDKALGDKVESAVGEALATIVERVEDIESAITDKERISKALSSKNSFKPMSRPAKAFTQGAEVDVEKELTAITEKLKSAKDKEQLEEVTKLLQAFVTSSVKTKLSAEDSDELETYRELGTIDEIEAAVEVLETYAEEIGTIPELQEDEYDEEEMGDIEVDGDNTTIDVFSARRRRALASRKAKMSSKKASKVRLANSSRVKRLRELRKKAINLSSLRANRPTSVALSAKKDTPGSLASELFLRNNK